MLKEIMIYYRSFIKRRTSDTSSDSEGRTIDNEW